MLNNTCQQGISNQYNKIYYQFSSVQFSCLVMSDSLQPHAALQASLSITNSIYYIHYTLQCDTLYIYQNGQNLEHYTSIKMIKNDALYKMIHYTPIKMAQIQNIECTSNADETRATGTLIPCWWECKSRYSHFRRQLGNDLQT